MFLNFQALNEIARKIANVAKNFLKKPTYISETSTYRRQITLKTFRRMAEAFFMSRLYDGNHLTNHKQE